MAVRHTPGGDGVALRDHLDQICRQTGRTPDELGFAEQASDIEIPPGVGFLWDCFWELGQGRSNNGFGMLPLSWMDMDAWARLTGIALSPWEALTLRAMDLRYLSAIAKRQQEGA